MRILNKIVFTSVFILFISLKMYSVNYVSAGAGPANWNVASSWSPSGIPGKNDNVTIAVGHTIVVVGTCNCSSLTVNGTIKLKSGTAVQLKGDYILTGSETGTGGTMQFNAPGTSITTVGGTTSPNIGYTFATDITIAAGSIVNKANNLTTVRKNVTVTNLGTYKLGTFATTAGAGSFINGPGASLSIRYVGFMKNRTFIATAAGNTVSILYNAGVLPKTQGATGFYNLTFASANGTKTQQEDLIVAGNLTIPTSHTLNTSNYNLSIGGNLIKNGTLTASVGKTITFNGTSAQTISSGPGTTTFEILVVDNIMGVTINSGIYLLNESLTVNNGVFDVSGATSFTMVSTAAKTARLGQIAVTGAISGNFIMQRYIDTRDTTWADLSSPVQGALFSDWASEITKLSYSYNPPHALPTQYFYNETADDWDPTIGPGTILTPGKGVEIFLTGSFSYANFPVTTLTTSGVPNQGDQDLSGIVSFNNKGSNLVGNPFQSSIAWSNVLADPGTSNISSNYDIFDYTAQTYSTFGPGSEIGAGQGFWAYATGAPSLMIPESAKTTTSNSSIKSSGVEPYLKLKLQGTGADNSYSHTLKIGASKDATNGWDINKDHPFRKSPNNKAPSITSTIDGKKSVINVFNSSYDSYSMPITTQVGVAGFYSITASGFNYLSDYKCIKLEDKLLNQTIDLSEQNASYAFKMEVSDSPDRFIIHFNKNSNCSSSPSVTPSNVNSDYADQVQVLPFTQGNIVNFNLTETTPTLISITDILGRAVVSPISVEANNQSVNVSLPEDFSGMYIIKIESSKGVITKKFIRK